MGSKYQSYRSWLIKQYHTKTNAKPQKNDTFDLNTLKTTELLPFVIKTYQSTLNEKILPLSANIKFAQNESIFNIDGPFGRGLELTEDITGEFVLLSAGTGFLPYVDLLDFLLKKAIWMAANVDGNETLKDSVFPQQDYGRIFKDATFYFYGAFSSTEDYVIKELLENLNEICQTYNLNFFYYKVKLPTQHNNETKKVTALQKKVAYYNKKAWLKINNLNSEFKKEQYVENVLATPQNNKGMIELPLIEKTGNTTVPDISSNKIIQSDVNLKNTVPCGPSAFKSPQINARFDDVEFLMDYVPKSARVYICGPPEMNKSVYNNLRGLDFEDYKLFLV